MNIFYIQHINLTNAPLGKEKKRHFHPCGAFMPSDLTYGQTARPFFTEKKAQL